MNIATENQQKTFFELIKRQIPEQEKLAVVLSEMLDISTDAVYRRMRGQKELTFSELSKLCNHFNISFDSLCEIKNNDVVFKYTSLEHDFDINYKIYLRNLRDSLHKLMHGKNSKMIFVATDIPVMHLVNYPDLMAFKVHTQRRKNDKIEGNAILFDPAKILDEEILKLYREIAEYYKRIPSVEIWTQDTLDMILKLICYFSEIGDFGTSDIPIKLLDQLREMMDQLKDSALKGSNSNFINSNTFNLYLSEIALENNYVYVEDGTFQAVFLKTYTINSILTQNTIFCNDVKSWMENLIAKSISLTGCSQKQCYQFFRHLSFKIEETKKSVALYSHYTKSE